MNILKTTKIYNNRIYLPKEILKKLGISEKVKESNGEIIIFGLNEHEDVVIFKNKEEKKSRFNISTSED